MLYHRTKNCLINMIKFLYSLRIKLWIKSTLHVKQYNIINYGKNFTANYIENSGDRNRVSNVFNYCDEQLRIV